MIIVEADTIQDAAKQLQYFARYKPYQYSGKWFLFLSRGETKCYRKIPKPYFKKLHDSDLDRYNIEIKTLSETTI